MDNCGVLSNCTQKNGIIFFQCTCGIRGSKPAEQFNSKSRCAGCEAAMKKNILIFPHDYEKMLLHYFLDVLYKRS